MHQARQLGISAVFQEFSLVPQLTVEENLFLGAELMEHRLLDKRAMHAKAREILERLGFPLKPRMRVAYLSRAEQQMVEIAKAFRTELSVLILDEPTASLTERETERLFALIEQAKRQGVGIIYITHRMAEIRRIGDRVTVLRDGRHVATLGWQEVSETRLVELMTGRVITQIFPKIRYAARRDAAGGRGSLDGERHRVGASRSRCAPARSSGSRAWSAPASRRWRAPASGWRS